MPKDILETEEAERLAKRLSFITIETAQEKDSIIKYPPGTIHQILRYKICVLVSVLEFCKLRLYVSHSYGKNSTVAKCITSDCFSGELTDFNHNPWPKGHPCTPE